MTAVEIRHDNTVDDGIATLYRERYARMVQLATRYVGRRAVAEELVQDAFTQMYLHWPSVEHPVAYLRTAVVNACRSWHRREATARARGHQYECATTDQLGARELVDAVSALAPAQRFAVMLRYYDDQSEHQIARTLGCSTGSVKSNLHRGLRNLRRAIEI